MARSRRSTASRPMTKRSRWPMTPNSVSPRHRPHLARCRRARIRHRRHQRRHHLDRDRAVWRHEGKRHRPGRLEIRHRGIPRSQIPLHGRHRPVSPSSQVGARGGSRFQNGERRCGRLICGRIRSMQCRVTRRRGSISELQAGKGCRNWGRSPLPPHGSRQTAPWCRCL